MLFKLICLVTTFILIGCRESAAPSTTAPSTTAPSTTAPSTTAPSTTAPSTTAPSTTAPSIDTPSIDMIPLWENSIGMSFKDLPAGEFMMGSPLSEPGRYPQETRQSITSIEAFSIGVTEVTQAQYKRVIGSNPSYYKGEYNPVESVNWDDAVEFCEKLSALNAEHSAGRKYRLPTEAEWEYACRAGTTTAHNFGEDVSKLGEFEWFEDNSGRTTHPVGTKLPNNWGLYDMHGNVSEFCSNWYEKYPSNPPTDPLGFLRGRYRGHRGGCWYSSARFCRSAYREPNPPWLSASSAGFRVALTPVRLEDTRAVKDSEEIKGQ